MTGSRLIAFTIFVSSVYCADFTTYFGGANDQYMGSQLAADSAGDTYVTGGYAFVTKLGPAGNIVFTIPVGGQCCPIGDAIAVDPAGDIWVGGNTNSLNLPLVNALQSTPPPSASNPGSGVGFLVKMAPDGTIIYSSYFGGVQGVTTVNGIATDQNGNVYLTGVTTSSDFPTTPGLPSAPVNQNGQSTVAGAFVTKLSANGQKIIYSTTIAGTAANCSGTGCTSVVPYTSGDGIAIDGSGNALVAGSTNTSDLPAASGNTGSGLFALKINAAGNELVYVTYLGPAPSVINGISTSTGIGARPISADDSGNAYIAGNTNSPDFPTTPGAYQAADIAGEAFVMKLNPAGATIWATLLGSDLNGSGAYAIGLDSSDNVWLTGGGFVAELSADGSARPFLEQFPSGEVGQDIAIDASGLIHVLGQGTSLVSTITEGQPLGPRALSIASAASGQFTGTIAPGEIISIYGSGLGPTTPMAATLVSGLYPTSLGGVQVLVNGSQIPLLYVSASQINAEIPSPVKGNENGIALVQVTNNSATLPDFRLAVVSSDFAVFENPDGSMVVINQDGTLNKIANPAPPGSVVSIWGTGFGAAGPPADGAVSMAANNYCSSCQLRLSDGPHSITETVEYAGTSPGLIDGLMQINFLIPTGLPFGGAFLYFTPPGSTQTIRLGWVNISQ